MYKVETFGPDPSLLSLRDSINIFILNKEVINVSLSEDEYGYSAIILYRISD